MTLEFEDTFEAATLDPEHWLPYYLPHWSSRERSAARYAVGDGVLRLLIEEGQEPWCPEYDGEVRVSSLQTGTYDGQHRFNPGAVVREPQPAVRLYTPTYGRIEVRLRASDEPRVMVALWLIGYEDEPGRSGEICVCEIFGRDVRRGAAEIGVGVHPLGDPRLTDDFSRVTVPIDATEFHDYAADWTRGGVVFSVDGAVVKQTEQSPVYPMQLMLGIYAFSAGGAYPKELVVDRVRVAR